MSEGRKGLGLFVNRKASAGAAPAAAAAATVAKPKDVKQRWLLVGGGVILLIIVSTTVFQKAPPPRQTGPSQQDINKATSPTISVTPADASKKAFVGEFGADLAAIKEQLRQQAELSAAQKRELEELRKQKAAPATPDGIVPPPSANTGIFPPLTNAPPPPPVAPSKGLPLPGQGAATSPPLPQGVPVLPDVQSTNPLVFDAPGAQSSAGGAGAAKSQEVAARAKFTKNPNAGMLPAGAFAPVALLNGLDAGTSSTTQTSPMPVLLNITDHATLPGAAKYKLRSCFVLGTGYGDMSAERVYIRFSRLSCVDKSEKLVLTQEVAGYVVDSDGKLGMRGMITDRQGARLAKATLAGFAQGLASALGTAQSSVVSNLTSGQTTSTLSGSGALRAAGLSGAQTAVGQLADFYLKEAQSIFPVITLDAGRTGTIVFTNSVPLNWGTGDGQYIEQVTPNAERR